MPFRNLPLGALVLIGACSGSATDGTSSGQPGGSTGGTPQTVAVVSIDPTSLTLTVGGTGTLTAKAVSATGATIAGKTAAWSTSNPSVATVDAGVVTGVAPGVALITATIDTRNAVVSVTVNAPPPSQAVFASIVPGGSHTCALDRAGKAYCWGYNLYGQLGIGSQDQQLKPLAVAGGIAFASISAGADHTCGVALSPIGAAYCWGENFHGELGDGTTTERHAPVLVIGGINFVSVSAGGNFTCGLAVNGGVYCWGAGGALGNGSFAQSSLPVRVASSVTFAAVSAGLEHACALGTDGLGYCWGQGQFLGDGVQSDTAHSTPVPLAGNIKFRVLQPSWNGGCAIGQDDQTYCWGQIPRTTFANSPTLLPGGLTFTSLGVGPTASHGCAITASHAAYCWGVDTNGQTGDGPPAGSNRLSPVAVIGGIAFTSILGGGAHTCGLTATGAAYCWGTNANGQIGAGPPVGASYFAPTPVVSP
jgi:alpha-tubulin suppressor-like RCC1 family protein